MTQSSGSHVNFHLFSPTYNGLSSYVPFNIGVDPEICEAMWFPISGDEIDFSFKIEWKQTPGDEVNFDFSCTADLVCHNYWADYLGHEVPIRFTKPWPEYLGHEVPIAFECDSTQPAVPNYFSGYLDFADGATLTPVLSTQVSMSAGLYDGATASFGMTTFPIIIVDMDVMGTGETLTADLRTESLLDLELFDGATFGGTYCGPKAGTDFAQIISTGDMGGTDADSVQFRTSNASTAGVNYTTGTERHSQVELSFKLSHTGTSYDDDHTDAIFQVGLFFTDNQADISAGTASWDYRNPYHANRAASNPNWVSVWLPFRTATASGLIQGSDGTIVSQAYDKTGLNLFDGSTIRIVAKPHLGGTKVSLIRADIEIGSAIFDIPWSQDIVPVWHYHNYSASSSWVTMTEMSVCEPGLNLETRPSAQLDPTFYDGSTLSLELSATAGLDLSIHDGATAYFDLTVPETPFIEMDSMYTGESVAFGLSTSTVLGASFYDGATLFVELDTNPKADLSVSFYDGSTVSFELASSTTLDVTFADGAYLSLELVDNPPAELELNLYDGATYFQDIATTITLRQWHWVGEALTFDLDTRPGTELQPRFYDGATLSASLGIAQQLGILRIQDGAVVSFGEMDFEEPYRFYDGATVQFDVATETTLEPSFHDGATMHLELDLRPSGPIGVLRMYDGASMALPLDPSVSKEFTSWWRYAHQVTFDMETTTKIDLGYVGCTSQNVPIDNIIDLGDNDHPAQRYQTGGTVVKMGLTTAPRMSMMMHDGATMRIADPIDLTLNMHEGSSLVIQQPVGDMQIRLCPGNFIPDGNYVDAELTTPYDDACYADYQFSGETLFLTMSATAGLRGAMYAGETVTFDLDVPKPMSLRLWDGATVRFMNPDIYLNPMADGAALAFKTEEPYLDVYDGAGMVMTLTTEYNVEFIDSGCLDNEYQFIDEHGDAIPELFRPVPIEGAPYSRFIKGRCY